MRRASFTGTKFGGGKIGIGKRAPLESSHHHKSYRTKKYICEFEKQLSNGARTGPEGETPHTIASSELRGKSFSYGVNKNSCFLLAP
ncbi:MAG: hypothetical protein COU46_02595 [Candidatus Niyogibacteria bacterium CG10_big_fil_rev_8_21_14_0_10_42_19]|uniref:Uncharacterized protein n=1 Tax=Candidatus Niyogibacteria bacterium CG10_big_fil_rev_8_21_14_0_10_42_19 TaxID=1974725 RepID=A0A2H0TFA4_9BACT|nr:MAG: hypothetical protein COU46_02595 [Candidatus Niyogibacteria bacterium CG10_big_fil_rev_8_21_14_0_10_42_19]